MPWIAWVWWSLAVGLGLAGAGLVAAGAFADRSKGRARCPKCWYPAGDGLTCPECGRTVRRRRQLHRTRRHRWPIAIGVILVLASVVAYHVEQARAHGWPHVVPSVAYVVMLPWMDDGDGWKQHRTELRRRVLRRELPIWLAGPLDRRMTTILEDHDRPAGQLDWVTEMSTQFRCSIATVGTGWDEIPEVDKRRGIEAVFSLLDHPDQGVRGAAVFQVTFMARKRPTLVPRLLALLDDESHPKVAESIWHHTISNLTRDRSGVGHFPSAPWRQEDLDPIFCRSFDRCGEDRACAIQRCLDGLGSSNELTRAISIWGIIHLGDHEIEHFEAILALHRPELHATRQHRRDQDGAARLQEMLIESTAIFPSTASGEKILDAALSSRIYDVKTTALEAIGRRGSEAAGYADRLRAMLADASLRPGARWPIARCLARIGGDLNEMVAFAMSRLELEAARTDVVDETFDDLALLADDGIRSPEAVAAVAPFLDDADAGTRSAAAFVTIMHGGDAGRCTRILCDAWRELEMKMDMDLGLDLEVNMNAKRHRVRKRIDHAGANARLSVPTLAAMLDEGDDAHQVRVLVLIGRYGDRTAEPALREIETAGGASAGQATRSLRQLDSRMWRRETGIPDVVPRWKRR